MKQHWKILIWMLAGVVVGAIFQFTLEAVPDAGLVVRSEGDHVIVTKASGPATNAKLGKGETLFSVFLEKGRAGEREIALASPEDLGQAISKAAPGDVLWFRMSRETADPRLTPLTLTMTDDSPRNLWVKPFAFVAQIFIQLLKMLIVPLVLTSIITGVSGVGQLGDLRRMGLKTFVYYITTSLFAIFIGQTLVNIIRPGDGAQLGLPPSKAFADRPDESFVEIFIRMIPENLFSSLSSNGAMLSIIFFGLIFGVCITRSPAPHGTRMREFFESAFEVMMNLAELVLKLIPYGAFCLLVKVVGQTGFGAFGPLLTYMVMIASGLAIHACIVLPLILKYVAGVSPIQWAKTMGPALMTAFSASSSSMTLPVTMECVEKRGGFSNRSSSFVLPLGATINMDGTALYECAGVIFLAQYYASTSDYVLSFGDQFQVVFMALFASIGAAGIPSAGLIMMLTILATLGLPLEGAALLLAVDRPLDMLRTMVNVWSDSVGVAVIGTSEGEVPNEELLIKKVAGSEAGPPPG